MSDAVKISREAWLQAYDRCGKPTPENDAAKKVFNALEKCDLLIVDFEELPTQIRARFLVKRFELIRVVVKPKSRRVFVSYHEKYWGTTWEDEFEEAVTGFQPCMGEKIVDWCVEHEGNTDKLIKWLIAKAKEKLGRAASQ